jgi:hypothetical protein
VLILELGTHDDAVWKVDLRFSVILMFPLRVVAKLRRAKTDIDELRW